MKSCCKAGRGLPCLRCSMSPALCRRLAVTGDTALSISLIHEVIQTDPQFIEKPNHEAADVYKIKEWWYFA